jgi:hypothetical protein
MAPMKRNPLTIISSKLSYNTRNALVKGIVVSIITVIVYLIVVAITTPNLSSNVAIGAALRVNGIIIVGLAIGVGIQVFASTYSRGLGCRLDERRKYLWHQHRKDFWRIFRISGPPSNSGSGLGAGGGTVISSFLSFFSLVPLGCCGSWLLILSMLPSVFGSTISVMLIEYSTLLSYVGLAIVLSLSGLSLLRLRRKLVERRMSGRQNSIFSDVDDKDDRLKTSNSSVVEGSKLQEGC